MYYFVDFYFMFIMLFVLLFNLFNVNKLIISKDVIYNLNNRVYNASENVFLNFKLAIFFILFYMLLLNQYSEKLNVVFISKFILFLFFIFLFYAKNYFYVNKIFSFEFSIMLMFSTMCLFFIIQTDNFLNFYIILEAYTLIFSCTILLKKFKVKTVESAFLYLVLNIIASLLLIYSISHIYFCTGLINFSDLDKIYIFYDLFNYKFLINYSFIIFILSFFIKLSVFPISFFAFKIYKGLPNIFVFYLLTIPKFIFLIFFFKISSFMFLILDYKFLILVYLLIFFTSLFHSIASLIFFDFKDILINVSFSNTPFLMLFIFLKYKFFLVCFINFIFIYFFNLFCIFLILLYLNIKKITSVVGLFYFNKFIFFVLVVNLISLASLPPFSNFFGKFYMFYFLIEYKMYYYYLFLSVLNLVIVYCYLTIIRLLFIKKKNMILKYTFIKKSILSYFLIILTFLNIFYLYFFDFVFILINNSLYLNIVH